MEPMALLGGWYDISEVQLEGFTLSSFLKCFKSFPDVNYGCELSRQYRLDFLRDRKKYYRVHISP